RLPNCDDSRILAHEPAAHVQDHFAERILHFAKKFIATELKSITNVNWAGVQFFYRFKQADGNHIFAFQNLPRERRHSLTLRNGAGMHDDVMAAAGEHRRLNPGLATQEESHLV